MDLKRFETELWDAMSGLPYVIGVEIKRRTEISLQGLIGLKKGYLLSVFYNEAYYVISFSLIYKDKRLWAIDRDNRVGWHTHPFGDPETHLPIDGMTVAEIIGAFDFVCRKMYDDSEV